MRQKATVSALEQVEINVSDCATKVEFSKILNRLESYTTLESFNKSRISQEKNNENFLTRIESMATIVRLEKEMEHMKDYVGEENKQNSQKRDCAKDKREVEKMFEKLQKELLDLRDDHRNSKERIRILELAIEKKLEKTEHETIKEYIELLPTKEEVTTLRNYMKNNIESFSNDNSSFQKEFNAHLAIIRRYDEVLSEKASKHSVYQVETKVNDSYRPVIKELDERIRDNMKLIQD